MSDNPYLRKPLRILDGVYSSSPVPVYSGSTCFAEVGGYRLTDYQHRYNAARRMVAAMNATRGIPTEGLEVGAVKRLVEWVKQNVQQIDHPSDPNRAIIRSILSELDEL